MTEWETEKTLHVYDKRVIQTPKGATKEGRIDRNLMMLTEGGDEKLSDDEQFLEHPSLYSFADLKAFRIVRHEDDYGFEEEAYTDDEEENYDMMDIKIPLGGNTMYRGAARRQIKRKSDESPGSMRFTSGASP